jgi:hypothetical protein
MIVFHHVCWRPFQVVVLILIAKGEKMQGGAPKDDDELTTPTLESYSWRPLQVHVELVQASLVITVREQDPEWPPYRIDNFTSYNIRSELGAFLRLPRQIYITISGQNLFESPSTRGCGSDGMVL